MRKILSDIGWGLVTILGYGVMLFLFLLLLALAVNPLGTR